MRRGDTRTLAAAPSSSRRSPPSSDSARPGCSGVPSSCRITDSQTLYGSSSQPISTSSVQTVRLGASLDGIRRPHAGLAASASSPRPSPTTSR